MNQLDGWLKQATCGLAKGSAAQVTAEIREHYDAARETAVLGGASAEAADRSAITALGDARAANRQYRKVLLTGAEARLLREGAWEARTVCSNRWLKVALPALPVAALCIATVMFLKGDVMVASGVLTAAMILWLVFAASYLPVYTPSRGRAFRSVRWVAMLAMLGLVFGADALKWSWLLISCLWPMVWVEWTRMSIRRKLPVAQWPNQLFL